VRTYPLKGTKMSKLLFPLMAGMLAVSAFAADTASLPAPQPKPVVLAPTAAAPVAPAVAPAAAPAPVAKAKAGKTKAVKKHVVKKAKKARHSA